MDQPSKICIGCRIAFPLDGFHKERRNKDGRSGRCKACTAIKGAAAYQRHLEVRKAAALEWRKKNRAKAAQASKEWRQANPERFKATAAAYRAANAPKVAAHLAKWHAANPDKVKAHRVTRKGLVRAATTIPFTGAQLAARMAYYGGRCWMCRGPFEHVDHVKPLSKSGPNMLANLRPSCQRCNLSKKDKWFGPAESHRFIKS